MAKKQIVDYTKHIETDIQAFRFLSLRMDRDAKRDLLNRVLGKAEMLHTLSLIDSDEYAYWKENVEGLLKAID